MKTRTRFATALCLLALFTSGAGLAQAPGIKRTLLQRSDIGNNMEVIMGLAEIAPGGSTGMHTHFGTETGYTMEGAAVLEVDGEPPKTLKAGDSYTIPAGKAHNARTAGGAPVKVLAVYTVEKGKPLATPVK